MTNTVKAGLILGLLVEVWTYVVGFAGWYRDPAMVNLFYLVVVIQLAVLVWALKKEAGSGKNYWKLVGAGTAISTVGAVIVFVGSLIFTMYVFPEYFAEVREAGRQSMLAQGIPPADVEKTLEMAAPMQTPFVNAVMGALMTVLTGFVLSLGVAFIVRKRVPPAAQG